MRSLFDGFVAKYTSARACQWVYGPGGAVALAINESDNLYVGGQFAGPAAGSPAVGGVTGNVDFDFSAGMVNLATMYRIVATWYQRFNVFVARYDWSGNLR